LNSWENLSQTKNDVELNLQLCACNCVPVTDTEIVKLDTEIVKLVTVEIVWMYSFCEQLPSWDASYTCSLQTRHPSFYRSQMKLSLHKEIKFTSCQTVRMTCNAGCNQNGKLVLTLIYLHIYRTKTAN